MQSKFKLISLLLTGIVLLLAMFSSFVTQPTFVQRDSQLLFAYSHPIKKQSSAGLYSSGACHGAVLPKHISTGCAVFNSNHPRRKNE